jgi:hypothetical protein
MIPLILSPVVPTHLGLGFEILKVRGRDEFHPEENGGMQ